MHHQTYTLTDYLKNKHTTHYLFKIFFYFYMIRKHIEELLAILRKLDFLWLKQFLEKAKIRLDTLKIL